MMFESLVVFDVVTNERGCLHVTHANLGRLQITVSTYQKSLPELPAPLHDLIKASQRLQTGFKKLQNEDPKICQHPCGLRLVL